MIYMVEMALLETARRAEWDAWYVAHQHLLLSIPGFRASQRFEAIHTAESPFVALHEVDSRELFARPLYRENGGPSNTGKWQAKMGHWHRNLFRCGPHPGCSHGCTSGGRRGGVRPGVTGLRAGAVDGGSRARSQRPTARARGNAARDGGPARRDAGHSGAETDRRAPPRRRLTRAREHAMKGIVEAVHRRTSHL